jgi:multiple sugar transport system ATP-binding protein
MAGPAATVVLQMADVQLDGVTRAYPNGGRAVADLTLYVPDREVLALVGPSGCGKSTTLRMIAGLEPVDAGTISIGGEPVNGVPPRERNVAMVFEAGALYPHMTAAANLRFGLDVRRVPEAEIKQRVGAEARVLGLGRLLDRLPRTLSAGQRQRVALGRATVRVPRVFLLDEPLTHLDAGERVRLRSELSQLLRGLGVTAIYVTHDQGQAMAVGDRIAVMRAGALEQVAEPRVVYERPANVFVASFVGSPPMALAAGRLEAADGSAWVTLGSQRLPLPHAPSGLLRGRLGQRVTVGVRAEHVSDAALAGVQGRVTLRATVVRADHLGSELLAGCEIDAPSVPVTDTPWITEEPADRRAVLQARLPPTHRVRLGDQLELAVNAVQLSFFDPFTGAALWHPG